MKIQTLLFGLSILSVSGLSAQFDFPALSPKGKLSQQIGFTKIEVSYERPAARGREIYGGLVPWNKVWRTGAGPSTTIRFSTEVTIGDEVVPAGNYALFTIPNQEEWTIILNQDTTLYGAYDYDSSKDVARVTVESVKSPRFYEALTIDIDFIPNDATMYISWTDVTVPFKIHTSTDKQLMSYINSELISRKSTDPQRYGLGAEHIQMKNGDSDMVIQLCMRAIELGGGEWPRRMAYDAAVKLGNYADARMMIISARDYINNVAEYDEFNTKAALKVWDKMSEAIEGK